MGPPIIFRMGSGWNTSGPIRAPAMSGCRYLAGRSPATSSHCCARVPRAARNRHARPAEPFPTRRRCCASLRRRKTRTRRLPRSIRSALHARWRTDRPLVCKHNHVRRRAPRHRQTAPWGGQNARPLARPGIARLQGERLADEIAGAAADPVHGATPALEATLSSSRSGGPLGVTPATSSPGDGGARPGSGNGGLGFGAPAPGREACPRERGASSPSPDRT